MRSFLQMVLSLCRNNSSMLGTAPSSISSGVHTISELPVSICTLKRGLQVPKAFSVWCPSRHRSLIACSRHSSHAHHPRVRTRYHYTLGASTMRCKDSRRSCTILASAYASPPRPWHSPACRLRSCDGECRFMRGLLRGIGVPFHRSTATDDRNESMWILSVR